MAQVVSERLYKRESYEKPAAQGHGKRTETRHPAAQYRHGRRPKRPHLQVRGVGAVACCAGHHGSCHAESPPRRAGYQTRAAEVGPEPWRSILSLPRVTQHLSTPPQSVTVITVLVCILWVVAPQAQELATSLIVLNALWLARAAMRAAGQTSAHGTLVQQQSTATAATGIVRWRATGIVRWRLRGTGKQPV